MRTSSPRRAPLARIPARALSTTVIAASVLVAGRASALQPLETFLAGAREKNVDNVAAGLTALQRDYESDAAFRKLLPAISARGTYTRNQFEAAATLPKGDGTTQKLVIQPLDQLDAFVTLDVPVVDLSSYARYRLARAQTGLAEASRTMTRLQIDKTVARSYATLAGSADLARAASKSVESAELNVKVVTNKKNVGAASDFDVERAQANVERTRQALADAELTVALARRTLETLSGISPSSEGSPPTDDLHEEPALATFEASPDLPNRKLAEASDRVAAEAHRVARYAFAPTLSLQGSERFTNATGFTGQAAFLTLSANAVIRFDLSMLSNDKAAAAASEVATVRARFAEREASDQIFEAWQRVHAGIQKVRAARAEEGVASHAEKLAVDRYGGGVATQLDVVESQRQSFTASANRSQAEAELAYARSLLRIVTTRADEGSKAASNKVSSTENPR